MTTVPEGPRWNQTKPELDEPYESLVRNLRDKSPYDEAQARLNVLLVRDLVASVARFHDTTSRWSFALTVLTIALVILTVILVLRGG